MTNRMHRPSCAGLHATTQTPTPPPQYNTFLGSPVMTQHNTTITPSSPSSACHTPRCLACCCSPPGSQQVGHPHCGSRAGAAGQHVGRVCNLNTQAHDTNRHGALRQQPCCNQQHLPHPPLQWGRGRGGGVEETGTKVQNTSERVQERL